MRLGRAALQRCRLVVTTFRAITEFTKSCGRGTAPTGGGLLLKPRSVPHDFQATPVILVAACRRADVLVKERLGLETFLDKLIVKRRQQRRSR